MSVAIGDVVEVTLGPSGSHATLRTVLGVVVEPARRTTGGAAQVRVMVGAEPHGLQFVDVGSVRHIANGASVPWTEADTRALAKAVPRPQPLALTRVRAPQSTQPQGRTGPQSRPAKLPQSLPPQAPSLPLVSQLHENVLLPASQLICGASSAAELDNSVASGASTVEQSDGLNALQWLCASVDGALCGSSPYKAACTFALLTFFVVVSSSGLSSVSLTVWKGVTAVAGVCMVASASPEAASLDEAARDCVAASPASPRSLYRLALLGLVVANVGNFTLAALLLGALILSCALEFHRNEQRQLAS